MFNTNKKLKIWTIITHAFILIGMGHGGLTFLILEVLEFAAITKKHISFDLRSSFENHLPVVALMALSGQLVLVYSILIGNKKYKIISHILGIVFLWLSIVYFTIGLDKEHYVVFITPSCIPFALCTILPFITFLLIKFRNWLFQAENNSAG